jgi:hypothetical protein
MWNSIIRKIAPKFVQAAKTQIPRPGRVSVPAALYMDAKPRERSQKVKYHHWRQRRRNLINPSFSPKNNQIPLRLHHERFHEVKPGNRTTCQPMQKAEDGLA